MEEIAAIALEEDLFIVSDECYEKFLYEGAKHYSIASFGEGILEKTITINAFSKTYSMTGWRLGYAVAANEIIKAMSKLQSQMTSNPNSIAQKAALAALHGSQDCVDEMVKEFDRRRKVALKGMGEIDGIGCSEQLGAFYLFPDVSALYKGDIKDSLSFCNFLLEKAHVALVPGSAFGVDSCVRFSYASPIESIEEGLERTNKAVKAL